MLRIENIRKTFDEKKILDNFNLTVQKGEIAILLGTSGVGKSTVLRVLNNLETPDEGTIFLHNKKLEAKDIQKSHVIGMVFQSFNLFEHMTVEQNITLALEKVLQKNKSVAKKEARTLLEHYGLAQKTDAFVSQLSGGQKQRLAIARTIALKPEIICLDEPTSALDPLLTSHVAHNIQELANEDYIVVVATHDTAILGKLRCTIHLMEDGKIIESASAQDFFEHRDKYPNIDTFVTGAI